jgi:hypothetical protein
VGENQKRHLDYDAALPGEPLASFEYVLTQDQLDRYRESVDDPRAQFPTIAVKHDGTALDLTFSSRQGSVNARQEAEFFNPPVPGKRIFVTARISDKYIRREKPYIVCEAEAKDEDGRLIERIRVAEMFKPDEVGKKWGT